MARCGEPGWRDVVLALGRAIGRPFHHKEIILDFTQSVAMLPPIPIQVSRGAFRRRSVGGERERHLRAKDVRNLRPRAVLGQPRRPLRAGPVRPRSKA